MCSWKALDVPGSHSHSFIRGFKMQWRRTIAELSWQPPCFAATDCLVWLGKHYTVVDVSSAFLIYIFIPYQLTEWFSPVVLKGNSSPKACVDLAKRETNALTKIFVHSLDIHKKKIKKKSLYTWRFVILFYQMKKQQHFSYGLSRHNFLKWGPTLEPNAYWGPWPGEERYTDAKQPPAARARLRNCHTLHNTVQCSVLPRVHWAVAAAPKCTTNVETVKMHHPAILPIQHN